MKTERYNSLMAVISTIMAIVAVVTVVVNINNSKKATLYYGIERIDAYELSKEQNEVISKKLATGKYRLLGYERMGINAPNLGDKITYILGKVKQWITPSKKS